MFELNFSESWNSLFVLPCMYVYACCPVQLSLWIFLKSLWMLPTTAKSIPKFEFWLKYWNPMLAREPNSFGWSMASSNWKACLSNIRKQKLHNFAILSLKIGNSLYSIFDNRGPGECVKLMCINGTKSNANVPEVPNG